MIQEFACNCLNVTVRGNPENVSQEELNLVNRSIDTISYQKQTELKQFFSNARWIKLPSFESVKIRYNFLCLKHNFGNFQINYCTICSTETHAVLLNPVIVDGNKTLPTSDHLALVCMNDAEQVKLLKSSAAYSAAFEIILPRNLGYQPWSEAIAETDFNPRGRDFLTEVDLHASEKVQQFLSHERQEVDERIKNFALKENKKFDELRQTVLDEQSHFINMVKTLGQQHDLINESIDKENITKASNNDSMKFEIRENIRKSTAEGNAFKQRSSKIRSVDFDGLFDIDDIDVEASGKAAHDEATVFEEEESEPDFFPLKEANVFSSEAHQFSRYNVSDSRDELLPLPRVGMNIASNEANSRRKLASSVVQNIPHPYQNKNRHHYQTPNSLPIKIPHFRSRLSDVDNDEGYDFKSGESIADRIMKIARSERNDNNDIDDLTDRPRCRLNTGDIIKSRRILN